MKEPMQRIVEAAGEKWHEFSHLNDADQRVCLCGKVECTKDNPSPTLDELFRLAEKATPWEVKLTQSGEQYICYFFSTPFTCEVEVKEDTPSDALLNALDQAIGGSDD